MKNKFIHLLRVLPLVVIFLTPYLAVSAQELKVNRVYDFSGNTDTLNSEIKFVYADSNRIIALGEAYPTGANPHAFTAAFDYSGNLLWEKAINLPNGLIPIANGYNTLTKVKHDVYVVGGNISNFPKASSRQESNPFLYLFNAQGDSIKFIDFPNDSSMAEILTAITIDQNGRILAGGDSWNIVGANSDTDVVSYPGDSVSKRDIWFCSFDDSLNFIKRNNIRVTHLYRDNPYFARANPKVVNIIPVFWDSIQFRAVLDSYFPINSALFVDIDSQFTMKSKSGIAGPPMQSSYSNDIILARSKSFETNFILRRQTNHSFYWSLPAEIHDVANLAIGIYYAKALSKPDIPPEGYQLLWDRAIIYDTANLPSYTGFPGNVQGRSSLAEAVNGDMLLQKEASRPSDTTLNPFLSQSGYFLPVMLRVDSNGNTRWGKTFQYVPSLDSGLYHSFNDVSVAPDGCIVMGGYLRSRYPVPGYDTVGTVSWLVMLCDSLHDHDTSAGIKIPSLGSKAEITVYPNPTLDNAFVVLQHFEGNLQDVQLQLCAINGRVLQSRKCSSNKELIQMKGYPSGIYFIKVLYHGKLSGTVKLVKD